MFENQVKKVFLGVGSNLGNRQKNIELSKYNINNDIYNLKTELSKLQ